MSDRSDPSQSGDYPVGYGKPPKHTQFKPGNPGRRKAVSKTKPKGISCTDLAEQLQLPPPPKTPSDPPRSP